VGSGVEISEQYGSNRGIFKFQIALKCPEMVRFARATHHSIRNIPKFPTHTRMLSYEAKIHFYLRKTRPPPHWQILEHGSLISTEEFKYFQKICLISGHKAHTIIENLENHEKSEIRIFRRAVISVPTRIWCSNLISELQIHSRSKSQKIMDFHILGNFTCNFDINFNFSPPD